MTHNDPPNPFREVITRDQQNRQGERPHHIIQQVSLACIIAKRARQLSEKKGRLNLEEGDLYFNPIQQAIREITAGKIIVETPKRGS